LFEGDVRRRLDYVHDPLEIIRDTSAEVIPPAGLYAPVSGFGLIWRGDVSQSPGYREVLGWALGPEFGYDTIFEYNDLSAGEKAVRLRIWRSSLMPSWMAHDRRGGHQRRSCCTVDLP